MYRERKNTAGKSFEFLLAEMTAAAARL